MAVIDVQVHPFDQSVAWGTDWTRTIGMLTYKQGMAPFRDTKHLFDSDKATLMGGTLQKAYK